MRMNYKNWNLGILALSCACGEPSGREPAVVAVTTVGVTLPGAGGEASSGEGGTTSVPSPTTGSGSTTGVVDVGSTSSGTSETSGASTDEEVATTTMAGAASTTGTAGSGEESGGDPPCAGVTVEAKTRLAPVDILLVVDNSGSMGAENAEVQANLNVFTDKLAASSLDFRFFLISRYPAMGKIGICVEPDLGSGGCPTADSKAPFWHIDHYVDSSTALKDILDTKADWYPKMRLTSMKSIVVVSDDDAVAQPNYAPTPPAVAQMAANAFHATLINDYLGFFDQYSFHAITGIAGSPCNDIMRIGATYALLTPKVLLERGEGVLANLCDQDFDPIFENISQSIADGAALPCELELPIPPMGEMLDTGKVNVHLTLEGMAPVELVRVTDAFDCGAAPGGMGWFYDDPNQPTKILLCGDACVSGQEEGAELALELGCASVLPG